MIIQGVIYLTDRGNSGFRISMIGLVAVTIGGSLLIGFLTPVASILTGMCSLGLSLSEFPVASQNLLDSTLSLISLIVMAAAIVLLGPGAFSIDARVFGRREIIIPPVSRSSKS